MSTSAVQEFEQTKLNLREEGYRSMPVLAPLSIVLGLSSIIAFVNVLGLFIPVVGVLLGFLAYRQIRLSPSEFVGKVPALAGLSLSGLMLISAGSLHAFQTIYEVPEGYQRVNMLWLAKQQPIIESGELRFPDEVAALNGQKVFVKGYMQPEETSDGIVQFLLCKDTQTCCFGGTPDPRDVISVRMKPGTHASYKAYQLCAVSGDFTAKEVRIDGQLVRLYQIEGDFFK